MKDEMNEETVQEDVETTEGDTTIEPELEDVEQNIHSKIKKLQAKLKECEQKKREYLENLQRAKAEFLNGKRRLEEEKTRDRERAITQQIEKLLPLCDSFHMAMSDKKAWNMVDAKWRTGVESIHGQLQKILESYNVSEFHPKGEEFNPTLHEAMTEVPVKEEKMNNKIVSVIQNGFIRKTGNTKELIRPARVTVGTFSK